MQLKPEETRTGRTIFDDYTYHTDDPTKSPYWEKAKYHLNIDIPKTQQDSSLVEKVELLISNLDSHNLLVQAAQRSTLNAIDELVGPAADHAAFFKEQFIKMLSESWRDYLKEGVRDPSFRSTLFGNLQLDFPRIDANDILRFRHYTVAKGNEVLRDSVAKATSVVADDKILDLLDDMADSSFRLQQQLAEIQLHMRHLKSVIELDLYETRTNCCPTPFTLFWRAFFG